LEGQHLVYGDQTEEKMEGNALCVLRKTNAYTVLVGKSDTRPLGGPKTMSLNSVGSSCLDSSGLRHGTSGVEL
jgi:inosine-uridine nucleoside N-ribohydrolase